MPTKLLTVTVLLVCIVLSQVSAGRGAGSAEQQRLVEEATLTFERFLEHPGMASWYRAEGKDIKAVFIIPRLLRGAFLVGAAGGTGVLLGRDFVKGNWSPPAFYTMSAGSFGLQAGADASQVIMIIKSFSSLERFYGAGTVRLGLDSGIALGPWGEGGTTGLDIVTFAWSKGMFGGMSLEGLAVTASDSNNEAYYGFPVKPERILSNGEVTNPGADRLRATVGKLIVRE